MPARNIVITGDLVLHNNAQSVSEINDYIRDLVQDMYDTMDLAPGVGLAAPQIGIPLAIFVYDFEDANRHVRGVAINPELELFDQSDDEPDPDSESEGCLSVPGERFPLKRAPRVTLRALDIDGEPYEFSAEGWLARIFQHEFDHLRGTLYVDRLRKPHRAKALQAIKKAGWGKPGRSWTPGSDFLEP